MIVVFTQEDLYTGQSFMELLRLLSLSLLESSESAVVLVESTSISFQTAIQRREVPQERTIQLSLDRPGNAEATQTKHRPIHELDRARQTLNPGGLHAMGVDIVPSDHDLIELCFNALCRR